MDKYLYASKQIFVKYIIFILINKGKNRIIKLYMCFDIKKTALTMNYGKGCFLVNCNIY